MESIKARFAETFGMSFDEFLLLDTPNHVALTEGDDVRQVCPCKYMLYSDPFVGFLDSTVRAGEGEKYVGYAEQLNAVAGKTERFGYLFDTAARLCEVLRYKYELGVKTRAAYRAGDREGLRRLATEDYAAAEENLRRFATAFENQWMRENKPYGFEVQHARLGGLIYRLGACRQRLLDYADGRVDAIPELEEEILPFRTEGRSIYYNSYARSFTSNVF